MWEKISHIWQTYRIFFPACAFLNFPRIERGAFLILISFRPFFPHFAVKIVRYYVVFHLGCAFKLVPFLKTPSNMERKEGKVKVENKSNKSKSFAYVWIFRGRRKKIQKSLRRMILFYFIYTLDPKQYCVFFVFGRDGFE